MMGNDRLGEDVAKFAVGCISVGNSAASTQRSREIASHRHQPSQLPPFACESESLQRPSPRSPVNITGIPFTGPMKLLRALPLLTAVLGLFLSSIFAQPLRPESGPSADLIALFQKIQSRLQNGAITEEALSTEIQEFDSLLEKYRDDKSDEVAEILYMKMALFGEVFDNSEKAIALGRQLEAEFPGTAPAAAAARVIAAMEQRAKARETQEALVGRMAPTLDFTWSSQEGLKSLEQLKGKVVVLDFWATWCGPCLTSFPQVAELVSHYEGLDVQVLGVTSLQGRVMNLEAQPIDCTGNPDKETGLMPAFMQAHKMTWPVVFSSQEVFNPDYGIQGIPHMTIIAPDGTIRRTGLHPAMPHAEKTAIIDAILKEFSLPTPSGA